MLTFTLPGLAHAQTPEARACYTKAYDLEVRNLDPTDAYHTCWKEHVLAMAAYKWCEAADRYKHSERDAACQAAVSVQGKLQAAQRTALTRLTTPKTLPTPTNATETTTNVDNSTNKNNSGVIVGGDLVVGERRPLWANVVRPVSWVAVAGGVILTGLGVLALVDADRAAQDAAGRFTDDPEYQRLQRVNTDANGRAVTSLAAGGILLGLGVTGVVISW